MKDNKVLQNYYFLPLFLCVFQFCFLIVALLGGGYAFEKKILIISFLLVCLWGMLFVSNCIQKKSFEINRYNVFLAIVFTLLSLNLIRQSWFSNYLRLDAVQRFFEGKTFIDTLYHSAIAESIVTNGYPSIQQNAPIFLSYHCLSHYLVAGISKALSIPCFVTYNYLFPIIFIPLFLFLIQRVALIGKSYLSGINELSFIDYIILAGTCCGFVTKQQQLNLGCNFNVNIFNSESCFLAIILLLLYSCLINRGYRSLKSFDNINLFILIPIFIFALSYAKISFGVIFTLGTSYYVFRKYILKDKKWFLFIGYCGVFIAYYMLNRQFSYSDPSAATPRDFILFHFVRTKCKNLIYIFLHYCFLFFPIVLAMCLSKTKILKDIFSYKKETIFWEMCFLLMLGACLPGIFMNIHGGSAFYFVIPVYIFSWILFISYDVPSTLMQKNIQAGRICLVLLAVLVVVTCGRNMKLYNSLKQTYKAHISVATTVADNEYILFNQIRNMISDDRQNYCIFLADDSPLINRFDSSLKKASPKVYNCRPYLATSAYLGVPVINSIYERNGRFYRGDDKEYGLYKDFASYSMPPAICGEKMTELNMEEVAKNINRSHVIVLRDSCYSIINIK